MANPHNYFVIDDGHKESSYYGNPKRLPDESLLSQIGIKELGFTPDIIKEELLGLGNDLVDPTTGKPYPESFYESMLDRAIATTEKEFDIVIRPRLNRERQDYNKTDFENYGYIRLQDRPIVQIDEVVMQYNDQPFMHYPDKWLKVNNRFGQLELQPGYLAQLNLGGQFGSCPVTYPFNTPLYGNGFGSNQFAPQMVGITYVAGMLPRDPADRNIQREWYVPDDLIAYVAKMAAIEVLERWGRLILGAGIAGYSISIDGINTQVNSTQSAENTGSTADIKLLQEDMKDYRDHLKAYYGVNLGVLS